jgi:hypothetical protein
MVEDSGTPLSFSYDLVMDILTVEGVKYSGDLFRQLAGKETNTVALLPLNRPFEIEKREDGVIWLHRLD